MGKKGRVRRVFPGSNSARGFFSFFTEIIDPSAGEILVLKGGPGCGKSTFMRKIGDALQGYGYDLEYHHCASDSSSLDGLVVPALAVALVDGTFPHVFDPPCPGAAGGIIDLGRFGAAAALRKNKAQIIKLQAEVGRLFKQAHRLLAIAGAYCDGLESYYTMEGVLDQGALDRFTSGLLEEILAGKKKEKRGKARRLFASAITPQGCVHHLETLIDPLAEIYLFHGASSAIKSKIIARVLEEALWRGFYVEAYHCALHPERIDHIVIPELGKAFINNYAPGQIAFPRVFQNIDSNEFAAALFPERQEEKNYFEQSYHRALAEAIGFLSRARTVYQELEGCYIPQTDFAAVDRLCAETLAHVLKKAIFKKETVDNIE